ncbi:MAG: IS3 family transposase [Vallitaleaceae bacterium]|nr:IS3 family transposase [Vallitaleaceae bacterium]
MSKGCKISSVCKLMGRSRQSYYKVLSLRTERSNDKDKLEGLVHPIRHILPRLGGKKLYSMIKNSMSENRLKMGRDRFFKWLKYSDLLVSPKKQYINTTQSHHRFWVYDNLAATMTLTRPNQLWVSDITYLRTQEGFCYLALITDAYSRKIVGFDVSDTLELNGCMRALKSALQTAGDISDLVHHSDRGIQYCSGQYTALLKQKGVKISMAAKGNCYENALAERVNGILKGEFNLDTTFKTKEHAVKAVQQSIYIYNTYRPHWSLKLKTPEACHSL